MKRMNVLVIMVSLLVVLLLAGCSDKGSELERKSLVIKEQFSEPVSTGTTEKGDVLVELTPQGLKEGKFEVLIAVNTHSVDLSRFNLKEVTMLEFEGKVVHPVSAPVLGGHHSSGVLVFDVSEELDTYTVTVEGIPKLEKRLFRWE